MIPTSKPKSTAQPWCVIRKFPNQPSAIIARFRSESDADGYLHVLRRSDSTAHYAVIYAIEESEAVTN
jgi:hypothetical protein